MNTTIKTITQLNEAITSTYIYNIIMAVAFVLILVLISNLIPWQSGRFDRSGGKRRFFFFLLLAFSLITPIAVNYFLFFKNIGVIQFKSTYMMHMGIAAVVTAVLYFLISFLLIKLQKKESKLASIFPKKK